MKFFYLWFKAVNDKYFQACANFDKIRNDFLKRNNEGIPFSPSKNIPNEILDNLEHAKNDEILAISLITALSFEIGFMKEHREYTLSALFSDPSSIRKCNTWRSGTLAGTLGGYGKRIQAFES